MKVSAWKRHRYHLSERRKYWLSVYTKDGLRRVPLPFIECYTEEGEIVPIPPLKWNRETPLRDMLPRMAAGTIAVNWKPITEVG